MAIVGLGIDLVDIKRIERLTQRDEDIFRARILGSTERSEISAQSPPHKRTIAYASSIAAKEAFLKALGTGLTSGMRWPEIEMINSNSRTPRLAVSGEARRQLSALGINSIHLSVSAGSQNVMATVVLTRESNAEAKTL